MKKVTTDFLNNIEMTEMSEESKLRTNGGDAIEKAAWWLDVFQNGGDRDFEFRPYPGQTPSCS